MSRRTASSTQTTSAGDKKTSPAQARHRLQFFGQASTPVSKTIALVWCSRWNLHCGAHDCFCTERHVCSQTKRGPRSLQVLKVSAWNLASISKCTKFSQPSGSAPWNPAVGCSLLHNCLWQNLLARQIPRGILPQQCSGLAGCSAPLAAHNRRFQHNLFRQSVASRVFHLPTRLVGS